MEKRHAFKFVYFKKLKKILGSPYILFSINCKKAWLLERERRWKIRQNAKVNCRLRWRKVWLRYTSKPRNCKCTLRITVYIRSNKEQNLYCKKLSFREIVNLKYIFQNLELKIMRQQMVCMKNREKWSNSQKEKRCVP